MDVFQNHYVFHQHCASFIVQGWTHIGRLLLLLKFLSCRLLCLSPLHLIVSWWWSWWWGALPPSKNFVSQKLLQLTPALLCYPRAHTVDACCLGFGPSNILAATFFHPPSALGPPLALSLSLSLTLSLSLLSLSLPASRPLSPSLSPTYSGKLSDAARTLSQAEKELWPQTSSNLSSESGVLVHDD